MGGLTVALYGQVRSQELPAPEWGAARNYCFRHCPSGPSPAIKPSCPPAPACSSVFSSLSLPICPWLLPPTLLPARHWIVSVPIAAPFVLSRHTVAVIPPLLGIDTLVDTPSLLWQRGPRQRRNRACPLNSPTLSFIYICWPLLFSRFSLTLLSAQ